jgi:hypothetical protein
MSKRVTLMLDKSNEVARALEDSEINEVTVVVNGRSYKVVEEQNDQTSSARRFSDLVREIGNPFEGMDTDKLKEDIYRWRLEGSRPSVEE